MIGKAIGHYQIETMVGAGGMGVVYQARDTRLGRSVAVKVLPEAFAQDPERVARFEREAKLLASLNHPNIASLYGLEQSDGQHFLVMELVDGDTLAERIQRGPIRAEEALKLAHQIAEAFEAAHEKGVIHRDLKPANVKVTTEGKVKVLDFGLAKALESAPAPANANSPTMLSGGATIPGIILGTAGYMSPEQARGHAADQRSDIFSFGCVLYEMLTGRQTFPGETVTDVIASVVARDPNFSALPANLHPKTEELLRRCLAKSRKERWHAIADLRVELETIMADPQGLKLQAARGIPKRSLWRRAIPPAITAVLGAAIAVSMTVVVMNNRPSPPGLVTRFPFVLPEGQSFTNAARHVIAMSPDGANIVYTANQQLYLRNVGEMDARPIQGTAQQIATRPFFSPDGRWVGYLSRAELRVKKIAITGGAAVTIGNFDDTNGGFGPVWNSDDYIYIGAPNSIVRFPANGGKPETVLTLKAGETPHRPQLLPGGEALLFTLASGTGGADRWDNAQIVVRSLKSGETKVLVPGGSDARYVPTGHIVYALGTTLLAVPFDVEKLLVTGGPAPIIEGVRRAATAGGGGADAQFAFSNNGSMVYIPGGQGTATELALVLVDHAGTRKPLNVPPGPYWYPRVSPNGKQLTVFTIDGKESIVWTYELAGVAPLHRLTFGGRNQMPIWTRDGQRIVFQSDRDGDSGLFWQRADGSGSAERLVKAEQGFQLQAESWSPDGKVLIFDNRRNAPAGIAMLSTVAGQKPIQIMTGPTGNSSLSQDGRWLAYNSTESGSGEVYVQPFPLTGAKYQITTSGGQDPVWSPDGKQLFYLRADGANRQIMSVDIQTLPSFAVGKTTPLPIEGIIDTGPRSYDITPDGKYFLVMVAKSQVDPTKASSEQFNVTLNWFEELKQRVPVK